MTDTPNVETKHPFQPFPGTDATMFIQWKGTNVCLDFHCPCGANGHVDDDFAYYVRCGTCDAVFELGTQAKAMRVDSNSVPGGLDYIPVAEGPSS